jgi:hypothetical protein
MVTRTRKTSVGLTDTLTGEIIDLTPLGRPPRKRTRKAAARYTNTKSIMGNSAWIVAMASTLGLVIAITK